MLLQIKAKKLEALINKEDHESIYKKIFVRLVKEKFDGIKELTYKIDHDDLICQVKNDTAKKNINNFENGIELL